jgi:molecular chaperone HscB
MPILSKNFFEFFELAPKLRLDLESLQKRFHELSREWHPDRFSRKCANGYRTLRDPVKRAEYLLTEEGLSIGEQQSRDVPPELLEGVFELNTRIEELKRGEEAARPKLEQAKQHLVELKQGVDGELENLFSKYDVAESHSETAKQALHEIRGALNRRGYLENLIRDVARSLDPAWCGDIQMH